MKCLVTCLLLVLSVNAAADVGWMDLSAGELDVYKRHLEKQPKRKTFEVIAADARTGVVVSEDPERFSSQEPGSVLIHANNVKRVTKRTTVILKQSTEAPNSLTAYVYDHGYADFLNGSANQEQVQRYEIMHVDSLKQLNINGGYDGAQEVDIVALDQKSVDVLERVNSTGKLFASYDAKFFKQGPNFRVTRALLKNEAEIKELKKIIKEMKKEGEQRAAPERYVVDDPFDSFDLKFRYNYGKNMLRLHYNY